MLILFKALSSDRIDFVGLFSGWPSSSRPFQRWAVVLWPLLHQKGRLHNERLSQCIHAPMMEHQFRRHVKRAEWITE